MALISLQRVSKSYNGGEVFSVRDIELEVQRGEFLVLLGESGSGKTTTLKMINRLVEPTAGRILVDGSDISSMDPVELRRRIGYVFQGIGLFPHMTVAQNVAVVPRLLGWNRERTESRVDELLNLVGLAPAQYKYRFPKELSGGQQQRVGFARALAAGPKIVLMDEPFGALDPLTRDALQTEFLRLQKSLALTVVMVTHDMVEALLMADRMAVMREGRIVAMGTPHDLMIEPGDPYVAALISTPKRQAVRLQHLAERKTQP